MITATQFLAFFNLFVGVMLVLSLLLFGGGFVVYLVRLGTWPTYREEAINIMMWGLSLLFTLVMLLGIQQFLLSHLQVAVTIAAILVIGFLVWIFASGSGGGDKKDKGSH